MRQATLLAIFLFCTSTDAPAGEVDFVRDVRPIFQKHCYSCHSETKQKSGLRLDVKSSAFKGGDGYGPSLIAGQPDQSPLIELVSTDDLDFRMPPEGKPLSAAEIRTLTEWVKAGAVWPDGVDLVQLEDRLDHWSFKPSVMPTVPDIADTADSDWGRNAIDRLILSRLKQAGLSPAPPADPVTWLRRVTYDLTGLPPTWQQVTEFETEARKGDSAYAAVVDRLLESPRYGERWAQHWLDVVRYADTHGFEVNTERPNAWPYRDYVIEAFNNDTPYNRFIHEQIAGDAINADEATGFLVTASVLLPGQIGKDAPSIRLARQDALDEIVNNIGQTFLGLSVGCARCHDHKFDPITAKDYYSMQAFVAGVEYAERDVISQRTKELGKRAEQLRQRVEQIDHQLARFAPLAHPQRHRDTPQLAVNAKENSYSFSPIKARYIRFTIHDANLHPTLGLIEPCIDEFEIFTDESEPRNIALASAGTQVTASGSRESAVHQLKHINDGQYGNARSWMSDTDGRGWVMFELPEPTAISKIVWSRDRNGQLDDRLATAFTLQAGLTLDSLKTLAYVPPPRPAIRSTVNIDRFRPVRTSKLRLTILQTNRFEPCIDELEVFTTSGENIALAELGTVLNTSGDTRIANRHQPELIHDGRYGNSSSWMASQSDVSWVELEFPDEHEIERVAWGRDRLGKFNDRTPTQYRIEIADANNLDGDNLDGDQWTLVADSTDRRDQTDPANSELSISTAGLSPAQINELTNLQNERQQLRSEIETIKRGNRVFAGKFRKPDDIRLLRRGDPEQPADPVTPAVLSALGELSLPESTAEQARRRALAEWIASPENPLTARVMANRIWQWHFGVGLVETANDFGRNGTEPSHPHLLDWLAQQFIESGWSIKQMHRTIVLSSTYRQSTQFNEVASKIDADVRLLWRYPARRLEAEAIRDSMLAISGQLNLTMGGPGFNLFNKRGGLTGFTPVESFQNEGLRRMIYAHKVRRERDAVFGAFDCPDGGQSSPRRIESTTPIQALNLFNSRFTLEQADAFADRVESEVGEDVSAQINRAYQLALSRSPAAAELAVALPVVQEHGLHTLCRVLFNSNEFLFLP